MEQLHISLLGTFRVQWNGQPVSGFLSNKVRALLAYLVVEADRPHQRVHLAGLLWPDWPEATARTYLRQALANLHHLLDSEDSQQHFLLTSRQSIQFNVQRNHLLDVTEVRRELVRQPVVERSVPDAVERLQTAVSLYRGSFLDGFFLDGCSAFEEWQLLTRERLQREAVEALDFLIGWHEEQRTYEYAQKYAWQRVELDPLAEKGHRQLVRLLALTGEPGGALAHHEEYRRLLDEELGVTPSAAMAALAEQIRTGRFPVQPPGLLDDAANVLPLSEHDMPMRLPPFMVQPPAGKSAFPFVAREQELAQLHTHLRSALTGEGRVVFVIGEAGQGKTLLIREFARQAQDAHTHLIVTGAACTSHRGIGDPFLPFRDILAQLSGGFEAQWAAGELTPDQARRIWSVMPHTVEALLTQGPDLIDTLVPNIALISRLALLPRSEVWRQQVSISTQRRGPPTSQQFALLDQCTKVLQTVARKCPLLLWIDDLHWADLSSIALLFHLGQRLAGNRILLLGSYRPEELVSGQANQRHPLERVIHEIQQHTGSTVVDLDQSQASAFVDAYLDMEPNRLRPRFRETLYRLSGGHALFTAELVRNMQEEESLIRDEEGAWIESPSLHWEMLPVRVDAAISERIGRLSSELRSILAVASVQGEQFTAEVVADVLGEDVHALTRQLSDELDRRHRIVVAQGIQRIGAQRLAHYRFRHVLFQKYLYENLDEVQRTQMHEAVAQILEACYHESSDEMAAVSGRLAWHYRQADMPAKATFYLVQAGNRAVHLVAHNEALEHFWQGLALLKRLPDTSERAQLELDLRMGLGDVQAMIKGNASSEVEQTFTRARQLCHQLGASRRLVQVLLNLWHLRFQRGEYKSAQELAEECLQIAERIQAQTFLPGAHTALGSTFYRLGQMADAQRCLAEARRLCDAQQDRHPVYFYGFHPSVNCRVNESMPLWYLGYPDQARHIHAQALDIARSLGHVPSIVFATIFGAGLFQRMNLPRETEAFAAETLRLSTEHGFALWSPVSALYQQWALVAQGHRGNELTEMRQALIDIRSTGMSHLRYAAVLADAYRTAGEIDESLALVEELLALVDQSEEREWEAELHRLRGELLWALNRAAEAEACFLCAIDVATEQQTKSLELRATTSICRLWQAHGRNEETRQRLSELYGWFTEGFDMPDMVEARKLLADLPTEEHRLFGITRP